METKNLVIIPIQCLMKPNPITMTPLPYSLASNCTIIALTHLRITHSLHSTFWFRKLFGTKNTIFGKNSELPQNGLRLEN